MPVLVLVLVVVLVVLLLPPLTPPLLIPLLFEDDVRVKFAQVIRVALLK